MTFHMWKRFYRWCFVIRINVLLKMHFSIICVNYRKCGKSNTVYNKLKIKFLSFYYSMEKNRRRPIKIFLHVFIWGWPHIRRERSMVVWVASELRERRVLPPCDVCAASPRRLSRVYASIIIIDYAWYFIYGYVLHRCTLHINIRVVLTDRGVTGYLV